MADYIALYVLVCGQVIPFPVEQCFALVLCTVYGRLELEWCVLIYAYHLANCGRGSLVSDIVLSIVVVTRVCVCVCIYRVQYRMVGGWVCVRTCCLSKEQLKMMSNALFNT